MLQFDSDQPINILHKSIARAQLWCTSRFMYYNGKHCMFGWCVRFYSVQ